MKTQRSLIIVRSSLALSFLVALACCLAAPKAASAQSTAEVCRQTSKVYQQYLQEYDELRALLRIKGDEAKWRGRLSDLRRAIAGGFVISGLNDITAFLNLPTPAVSNKERLAAQKTVRDALESAIQKARDTTLGDLEAQRDRVTVQATARAARMIELNCAEVLVRERSSEKHGCDGFDGTWNTSFGEMSFKISGNSATASYSFDNGHVSGTLSAGGRVLSGTYIEKEARGRFVFTLADDGQSFSGTWQRTSGRREPPSGTWEGKCTGQ